MSILRLAAAALLLGSTALGAQGPQASATDSLHVGVSIPRLAIDEVARSGGMETSRAGALRALPILAVSLVQIPLLTQPHQTAASRTLGVGVLLLQIPLAARLFQSRTRERWEPVTSWLNQR